MDKPITKDIIMNCLNGYGHKIIEYNDYHEDLLALTIKLNPDKAWETPHQFRYGVFFLRIWNNMCHLTIDKKRVGLI